jgi:hypothetical protein
MYWGTFRGEYVLSNHDSCQVTLVFDSSTFQSAESFLLLDYFTIYDLSVGLAEKQERKIPVVYPNPVKSIISFDNEEFQQMEVMDIQGRRLGCYELFNGTNTLDLSFLSSGTYLIRFCDKGERCVHEYLLKY